MDDHQSTQIKPNIKLRDQALNQLQNDKLRIIVSSQFSAMPKLEDAYYEYISSHPPYADIYKRWILSQSPLPPLPTDDELYRLRENIFGLQGSKVNINQPLLSFFLDVFSPFLDHLVTQGLAYYKLKDQTKISDDGLLKAVTGATVSALTLCGKEDVQREGYDSFLTAFLDKFKTFFSDEIASVPVSFPADEVAFAGAFEKEWLRLYSYSDNLYGFEVMPAFTPEDLFRYLRLPFLNQRFRSLSKHTVYRQAVNYVSAIATFKPVPDARVRIYYRQELCALFMPLVNAYVKKIMKKGRFESYAEKELQLHLEKKLADLAFDFDYFYTSTRKLKRNQISPFNNLFLPLRGRLARLGHIFFDNEYPFTSYVTQKLQLEVSMYFHDDEKRTGNISLDELNANDADGEIAGPLSKLLTDEERGAEYHVLGYDAKDDNGTLIGWKIRTFAGIVRKSIDTLRRWDRQGLLTPKRYTIYSKLKRKNIRYRAYTREDRELAKTVSDTMERKKKHCI